MDNVGGVFLVLVFGSLFAGFVALAELMYEVHRKEDKVRKISDFILGFS